MSNTLSESQDIVVFDLETTGMNCEEEFIIEIGAVKVRDGRVIDEFHSFVSCPQRINKQVERLTGVKNIELAGAPSIKEVLENFYRFAGGCTIAAYNLPFQYKFLEHYGKINGINFDNGRLDILPLAQEKLQGQIDNFKLSTVAQHFGIGYKKCNGLSQAKAVAGIFKMSGFYTKFASF